MNLGKYDYKFPPELVAEKPAHPRDSAKLLVYDRKAKKISYDIFRNLGKYLPAGAVLVLNDTKVIPARLAVKKESGGILKLLYVKREGGLLYFLCPSKLNTGRILYLGRLKFEVQGQKGNHYILKPSFPSQDILKILNKYGEAPIPPYIKHTGLTPAELKKEYQTVFAKHSGSIAAPTASLHFTRALLARLKKQGIAVKYATLHVGLGTFAPLTEENIKRHMLHSEHYEIAPETAKFLQRVKKQGRKIIPVGTTALRALESWARTKKLRADTRLFIKEGDKINFADGLVTNFHVPRSSLIMLASALIGRKTLLNLYRLAMRKKFRLFSFGDGMLIR